MVKLIVSVSVLGLSIIGFIGWVKNIILLTQCNLNPLTIEPVLRIVGIFAAPVGGVIGFIPHF